jgi:hypothetical protein
MCSECNVNVGDGLIVFERTILDMLLNECSLIAFLLLIDWLRMDRGLLSLLHMLLIGCLLLAAHETWCC